jgi:hypothetical protein
MSKQKSEFLGALGKYMEISKAVVNEVLGLGGSDEDVRRILTVRSLRSEIAKLIVGAKKILKDIFSVRTNYDLSIKDLVKACDLNWANDDITDEHFVVTKVGQEESKFVYVHLDRLVTTREVLEYMKENNLQPADIKQLLSFGKQNPDEQRKHPIVELGSVWVHSHGNRHVAFLYGNDGQRRLALSYAYPDGQWDEDYRFLAVSQG